MKLTIEGSEQTLMPIKEFRARFGLAESFGVAWFEPKDYTGLAKLDEAGASIQQIRHTLLANLPARSAISDLMPLFERLTANFAAQLTALNPQIGLREPELEFAIAGFSDVLQALLYGFIRSHTLHTTPPDFGLLYHDWLQSTVRIAAARHPYPPEAPVWSVRILNHIYGRVGLLIETADTTYYVADMTYACPAQGFMETLLREIAAAIEAALG